MYKENKTICIFATRWGSHFGGINVFNREMCIGIKEFKNSLNLVCIVNDLTDEEESDARLHEINLLKVKESSHPIEIIETLNRAQYFPEYWIGHDIYTGDLATGCSKITISYSAVVSHFDYEYYASYKGVEGIDVHRKMQEQKRVLLDADVLFSVGPKLSESVYRLTRKEAIVLNPSCFSTAIEALPTRKGFFTMATGRLDAHNDNIKRASIVIDAYSRISKEIYEDKMLSIYGIEEESLSIIAENNAKNILNIKALPFSNDREQIFQALSEQTMFSMPSLHEGFGLTGLEAISMNIPLAISVNSGLYEMLENFKLKDYIYKLELTGDNESDSEKIYKAMYEIHCNKEKWRIKAKTLKDKLLENTTWKKLGKTIVESLLSKKQESYFPIKNEKELECFKKSNILDNQELLRQYVFIEYKKILDRNNGELEKKYGRLMYLIFLSYESTYQIKQSMEENKSEVKNEFLVQKQQIEEYIEEFIEAKKSVNLNYLLDINTTSELIEQLWNIDSIEDLRNSSINLNDVSDVLDLIIKDIESELTRCSNELIRIESDKIQEIEPSLSETIEEEFLERQYKYIEILEEVEDINRIVENFKDIDVNVLDEIDEEMYYIDEQFDEMYSDIISLNKLIHFLEKRKELGNMTNLEKLYIDFCLLINEKLKINNMK